MFHYKEKYLQILFTVIPVILLAMIDFVPVETEITRRLPESFLQINSKFTLICSAAVTVYCVYYFVDLFRISAKRLEEKSNSLATIIENIHDSIWQLDNEFRLINYNRTFYDFWKINFDTIAQPGMNALEVCRFNDARSPGLYNRWKNYYSRAISGETFTIEEIYKFETPLYKEITFSPLVSNRQITGLVVHSKDITHRKQQELLLRESSQENRMLALVASTTEHAVLITEPDCRVRWVNSAFEKISGYISEEVKNTDIRKLFAGNNANTEMTRQLEYKFSTEKAFNDEFIIKRSNGDAIWLHISVTPLHDEYNKLEKFIVLAMDITERKESEKQLRILLQHSEDLNRQLRIRDNELQESIIELNRQRRELQTSQVMLVKQKKELESVNSELLNKAAQLEEQNLFILEKNSDLESARKDLSNKAFQLEQSNRYKSEFLANMSHELRTPLNSILILSKLLSENTEKNLTEKQMEFAENLSASGTNLLVLINDILDLSKLEAGQITPDKNNYDLRDITTDLEIHFRESAIARNIQFDIINPEPEYSFINTDITLLNQVLKNLLANAFKFTNEGGQVSLKISCDKINQNFIFTVKDNGIGIPKSHHDFIFDSFHQVDGGTSRKFGGTGLGLSISSKICKLLGGSISVNSLPGEGSEFTVIIPAGIKSEAVMVKNAPVSEISPEVLIITGEKIIADEISSCMTGTKVSVIQPGISPGQVNFQNTVCIIYHFEGNTEIMQQDFMLININTSIPVLLFTNKHLTEKDKIMFSGYVSCYISGDIHDAKLVAAEAIELIKPGKIRIEENHIVNYSSDLNGKKILVADDDTRNTYAITSMLEDAGLQVLTAEDGNQAIEILKNNPDISLVLMDIMMPGLNGYETTRRIRQMDKFKNLPIVALTAKAMKGDDVLSIAAGMNEHITKPVDSTRLVNIIIKYLNHKLVSN